MLAMEAGSTSSTKQQSNWSLIWKADVPPKVNIFLWRLFQQKAMANLPSMEAEQYEKEILYLHPSKNSSFVLVSSPLNAANYLTWSRAVYAALGYKIKLAFIDGSFPRPPPRSALFEQWKRADLMVTSWLWNLISRDIVEAFM
ncbi:UNVERIFIED_CONTAM: hypothetical protein Sindi_0060700 [Sesamum indicum]